MKDRVLVALLAAALLAAVAVGYAGWRGSAVPDGGAVSLSGPGLLVRDTATGRAAIVDAQGNRQLSTLECSRIYAANGTGVCLRPDLGAPGGFEIAVLDATMMATRRIPLVGVPSRARVSASGRMISWTVFVTGDSYNGGRFSTRSGILDTRDGTLAGTLEDFAVTIDGKPYTAQDLNFWGVTFAAGDNLFYATMSTAEHRYLVEGDFAARTFRVLHDNVECPSLSPDASRIAYKKRISDDPAHLWRLTVLSLSTMTETPLAETRGVDDQAAWLDSGTIGYAIAKGANGADIWAVAADGTGAPRLIAPNAESPAAL